MATEKELAEFIGRVAQRSSLAGRQRASFVAVSSLIEGALAAGHSMRATWETLHASGKITMTYETFRAHCRRAGMHRRAHGTAQRDTGTRGAGQRGATSATPVVRPQERFDDRPRTFQHSSVPDVKALYGEDDKPGR